jgi:hypothetical protein
MIMSEYPFTSKERAGLNRRITILGKEVQELKKRIFSTSALERALVNAQIELHKKHQNTFSNEIYHCQECFENMKDVEYLFEKAFGRRI